MDNTCGFHFTNKLYRRVRQGELPEGQEKVLWRIPVSRNSLARYYGRHLRI